MSHLRIPGVTQANFLKPAQEYALIQFMQLPEAH